MTWLYLILGTFIVARAHLEDGRRMEACSIGETACTHDREKGCMLYVMPKKEFLVIPSLSSTRCASPHRSRP